MSRTIRTIGIFKFRQARRPWTMREIYDYLNNNLKTKKKKTMISDNNKYYYRHGEEPKQKRHDNAIHGGYLYWKSVWQRRQKRRRDDGPVFGGESSAVGQREIFTLKCGVTKFKHTIASPLRCGVRSSRIITEILCARVCVCAASARGPNRWTGRTRERGVVVAGCRPAARGGIFYAATAGGRWSAPKNRNGENNTRRRTTNATKFFPFFFFFTNFFRQCQLWKFAR